MTDIKKDYAIRALKRIKQIQSNYSKLKALGVDLIEYEDGVNLIEESIATMFTKSDKQFESALQDVQWWLYDNVDKVITVRGKKIDVRSPQKFINWLSDWYKL